MSEVRARNTRRLFALLSSAALAAFAPAAHGQREPEPAPLGARVQTLLRVESVSPAPEVLDAPRDAVVTVRFNKPIDPASLDAHSFHVLGRWSGPVDGQFVMPDARTVSFVRGRDFSPAERVSVAISSGLRAADGTSMAKGHAFSFWVQTGAGSMSFVQSGVLVPGDVPYGAHGGDLDDDGDLDLAIPNENSSDVSVFLNNGAGAFGAKTSYGVGFHCSPNEGLDLSGDGVVDLAVANILDNDISILIGRGDGTFEPQVRYAVGSQPRGLAALDADADGDADLVTANRSSSFCTIRFNRGDGVFDTQATFQAGVNGETGVAAADFNLDGIIDLVVIGYGSSQIGTVLGDGLGGFAPHTAVATSSRPWMVTVGDLNGDGFPDAAAACSGAGRAGIYFGDGTGALGPETWFDSGEFPIAIDLGDLDGDGDLDLVTSSYTSGDFHVYTNDGAGQFTLEFTMQAVVAASCAVLHDRDGDGDTDITGIDELGDRIILFRQE
ncbi:MAG: VCBS repeat-containing protein [Phycisphaerales bacterium]|nr:VCBS repeat-containing protein [Phycisphaerales bacterium]